jgi:uncharacterized protein (DUF2252 family)
VHVDHERDAARVVLEARVVEALRPRLGAHVVSVGAVDVVQSSCGRDDAGPKQVEKVNSVRSC